MSPDQYCQQKATKSGSSFYYSFLFLPVEKRQAITALYAFCREVDDVVDGNGNTNPDPDIARTKLDWWRNEIERLFKGNPQHPVAHALLVPVQRFNFPEEYFQEIIDGMEMDLDQNRYESFSDLALYCYRVAGVVGLLSAEIFGYKNRSTLKYAQELGTALQLTNILRDIREDASRGRIYIPQDEMLEFHVNPHDLLNGVYTEPMHDLFLAQSQRARQHYTSAMAHLHEQDRYAQRSGIVMSAIYQTLLNEIEQDGFQVMTQRTQLTPLRKLWIAWRTIRNEKYLHKRYQRNKLAHQ